MLSFIVSLIKLCYYCDDEILNYYENHYFKGSQLAELYDQLFIQEYPIVSIEDGFDLLMDSLDCFYQYSGSFTVN